MIIKKLSLIAALAFAASALADNYILNPIDFYVDTDSVTNVYLNGAGPRQSIDLSTDVVFDAILTPSVYDEGLCPDVSAVPDAKFALYFGQDGAATNLYVIAAGANIVSLRSFSPTNYCLDVENFITDGSCRVTVYALLSVSTNGDDDLSMMGFVVFVNGEAVTCRDDDYEDKLPQLQLLLGDDWNDIAKALIANKYLFPSLIPFGGSEVSSKLQDVNFVGTGRVEALRAGYAPFEAADFADVSVLIQDTPEPTQEWTAGGEPKEYGSADAAAAAVAYAEANGGITVAWPTDAGVAPEGWTTGGQAKYSALFTLSADGKVVSVVLKAADDSAVKAVEESLTEATKDIDFDAESVTVEAVPGLYYGVSTGEELDSMSVEEWKIATGDTVTVDMPERKGNQTSGFYRLEASPTPTKPVQE